MSLILKIAIIRIKCPINPNAKENNHGLANNNDKAYYGMDLFVCYHGSRHQVD